MANESSNGSNPAKRDDPSTEYERFERLTREILKTTKTELDKRLAKEKRSRSRPHS
jgi:hypothetical protein